jgi:hypothetical protein
VTAVSVPLVIRARDVLASEWTKLRAQRAARWTMLGACVAAVGLGAYNAYEYGVTWPALAAADRGHVPPLVSPLTPGFENLAYAALAAGVIGVAAFSTEHASGLIRTTFTAVPRRWAVLAAKAAVVGVTALAAGQLLAFAVFFLTQGILSGPRLGVALSHPGAARAVIAAGLTLPACALLGLGLGAVIRSTTGAVSALFGLAAVLPVVALLLPSPWNHRIGALTLGDAAAQAVALHPEPGLLSPVLSLAVLAAWPAVALLAAVVVVGRRDA